MGKVNWYANSYRKLFFDFHSHSSAVGLASAFDAERWAQRLEEANAQAVSVFVKGGRGWSLYRRGSVRHVHPHLPEGLDMLEEQLQALHKRGIETSIPRLKMNAGASQIRLGLSDISLRGSSK